MSSKRKNFEQFLIQADMRSKKRGIFPSKNSKIHPFEVKSDLESNCKRFRNTALWDNFSQKTWPTDDNKVNRINDASIFTKTKKRKRSCIPFLQDVWKNSEHQIRKMYASKIVPVFSIHRRPETYFQNAQGQQRASALICSIKEIRNTSNTAQEAQHQKTVITEKLGKLTCMVFRKYQNVFSSLLSGKLERKTQKDMKQSFSELLKPVNRYYKIPWLISTGIFKEETRIHHKQSIENTWCRQKERNLTKSCKNPSR